MYNKVSLALYYLFMINYCFSVSNELINATELEGDDDIDQNNETYFFQQSLETQSANTTEEEVLFWTVPQTITTEEIRVDNETESDLAKEGTEQEILNDGANDITFTTRKPSENSLVDQADEDEKNQAPSSTNSATVNVMNEKITLQRRNCHLEIMVQETEDLKMQITFGKLKNNTSGKCCITLNGERKTMLGVFISNLHLYQNASKGEVLKVVIVTHGSDFILKEYYPWSNYQPLLLTETHRVYIVLQYNVTKVPLNQQNSHFNLEVFNYHRYENFVQQETGYPKLSFLPNDDIENFSKKGKPVFIPYF